MATLKDVAKVAGVSPITVSRVINSPDCVKEKTRARVEQAMVELKYATNAAARCLATNRSGVIDVYIPDHIELSNPFVMYLIAGISDALSRKMYSFLVLRNKEQEHLCDGYIVTGLVRNEFHDFETYARERDRPITLFGHSSSEYIDCIDVDNIEGSRMGVEYLIKQGHTKIAMINVMEDKDYTDDRLAGYRKALKEADIAYDAERVVYAENSSEGGVNAVHALLSQSDFTAIFCATDTLGIGVSAELNRLGYSVPQDVSLLGFDGLGHHLLTHPTLTTMQQPVYEIGRMLAESLLDKLDGKNVEHSRLFMPNLLVGGSTAAPQDSQSD